MSKVQLRYAQLIAGVVFALSLFLPFMKGTVVLAGSLSVNGLDKLGSADALVIALIAIGLVINAYRGTSATRSGNLSVLVSIVAVVAAGYYYTQLMHNVSDANTVLSADDGTGAYGVASIGIGAYVMVAAAATSLLASAGTRAASRLKPVPVPVETGTATIQGQ